MYDLMHFHGRVVSSGGHGGAEDGTCKRQADDLFAAFAPYRTQSTEAAKSAVSGPL